MNKSFWIHKLVVLLDMWFVNFSGTLNILNSILRETMFFEIFEFRFFSNRKLILMISSIQIKKSPSSSTRSSREIMISDTKYREKSPKWIKKGFCLVSWSFLIWSRFWFLKTGFDRGYPQVTVSINENLMKSRICW